MIPLESCPIAECKHTTDVTTSSISLSNSTLTIEWEQVLTLMILSCPGGKQPAPGWLILHVYDAVFYCHEMFAVGARLDKKKA